MKSFWREMGRNTGKRVSNAVYGDKWSTPYRARVARVDERDKKSKKNSSSTAVAPRGATSRSEGGSYNAASVQRIIDMVEKYSVENARLSSDSRKTQEARRREADEKVMSISRMSIPNSEYGLVDMMGRLETLHAGLDNYGFDGKVKRACLTKFNECYSRLEREYPNSPQIWHFYFIRIKRMMKGKGWLLKTYFISLAVMLFVVITGTNRAVDYNVTFFLLAIGIGVPGVFLLWQAMRLRYFSHHR